MQKKMFAAVEVPAGYQIAHVPVDGYYAAVVFTGLTARSERGIPVPNPFPVIAARYLCERGIFNLLGAGSDVVRELAMHEFKKIFLVGFPKKTRIELDRKLARVGITLEPEDVKTFETIM